MTETSFESDTQESFDGGSGSRSDDGGVHCTEDYDSSSGVHESWDEKGGEIANEHITVHGTDERIELDDEDEADDER